MMFVDILTGLPHVNGGALKALAVTTKERSPLVPNLPSMQEAGVPDFDISSWQGYFGPAGMNSKYYAGYKGPISTATGAVRADYVTVQMFASVATGAATPEAAAAEAEQRCKRYFRRQNR